MATPSLRLEHRDAAALLEDIQNNLRRGRAFVPASAGPALAELERCELRLCHPDTGDVLALPAEVVWVKRDEPTGFGLKLLEAPAALAERLHDFVAGPALRSPDLPARRDPARDDPELRPAEGDQ